MPAKNIDSLLGVLLTNKSVTTTDIPEDHETLLQRADWHGITPLLYHQIQHSTNRDTVPAALMQQLQSRHQWSVANNLLSMNELDLSMRALESKGLDFMILKGTALAYSLYPFPQLRLRSDTDLLFPDKESVDVAGTVLRECGYEPQPAATGELLMYETCCYKSSDTGVNHYLDLHWQAINHPLFAHVMSFDELKQNAEPLPISGAPYRPSFASLLLIACIHRITNIPNGNADRLIWLYDIHLLIREMDDQSWPAFKQTVIQKKLCAVMLDCFKRCNEYLGTEIPRAILDEMNAHDAESFYRPRYGLPRWRYEIENIRLMPDWRSRMRLVLDHLFPPPGYMLDKYQTNKTLLLPWLYIKRIVTGIMKLFK